MAAGDIIFEDGTILTPADLEKLLPLLQEKLSSTAKDPGQYPVLDRLEGVTSIPCFNASYDLVRVLVAQLKGNTGDTPDITFKITSLPFGSAPTVEKTGTVENPLVSIGLPGGKNGERIVWRKTASGIEVKYEGEPDSSYKTLFAFDEVMPDVSDFSEEGIALLQRPATEAATEARRTMAAIEAEAAAAIQSATEAAEMAEAAAGNVQDGKTPVITIGTVEDGPTAVATLTPAGTDESGNPKSALNLVLPKGKDGQPPVVNYSVLTGDPGTEVKVSQEETGFTPEGNPIYDITLTIPRGERGLPGLGSGNVYVDGTGLLTGEKYLFVPSATDSTEGTFVKYEDAPADGKSYARKDGAWTEVLAENILSIPQAIFEVDLSATSEEIFEAFGGKEAMLNFAKNFDTKKLCILGIDYTEDTTKEIQVTPIETAVTYKDEMNYQISFVIHTGGGDINVVISVESGLAKLSGTGKIFAVNASNDVGFGDDMFLMYDSNRSLVWNHNRSLDDIGGWGPRFAAYSLDKSIKIVHKGNGTKALTDDGTYKTFLEDAPLDGKAYARKDGKWSEIEAVSKNEVVKIVVTSNQAQPDADLIGAVITVTYAGSDKTFEWNGTEVSNDVPVGIEFTVSCSNISGYATPQTRTFTAIANNTRIVTLSYNTTLTTINVISNQSESDFVNAVTVNLTGEVTKTLTGALSYTIKIPTGATYNMIGSEVAPSTDKRYTTPASKPVTATGPTQTETISYTGCKLNITVNATKGSVTPMITVLKGSDTLDSWSIASGSTKSIIVPLNTSDRYTIKGEPANDYKAPEDISDIIPNLILIYKTFTYTLWVEDEYAYWVIFDESAPTTILERGGNEAVRDAIRAKFKRCLAMPQANGKAAIAYLNETDSTKWPDGSSAPYNTKIPGKNLMVYFPKYYYRNEDLGNKRYKYYISEINFEDKYKEERECLIGIFEASSVSVIAGVRSVLGSFYGVESGSNATIEKFYTAARNNGSQWGLIDYRAHKTIANMFCIMYGNTNIHLENPLIPCSGGIGGYNTESGKTINLGNKDGNIDNVTSFLGLENCYAGKMEFVQGININRDTYTIYDGGLLAGKGSDDLILSGFTNVRSIYKVNSGNPVPTGYITKIVHGEYADILPVSIGGTDTTYYSDMHDNSLNKSNTVFVRSGHGTGGVFYSSMGIYPTDSGSVGSRLGFYGTIEVKTKDEWLALTPDYNG